MERRRAQDPADGRRPAAASATASGAAVAKASGGLTALGPDAHALTLFRELSDGRGRQYTAVTFPRDPWQGCEHTIRTAIKLGVLAQRVSADSYAVLDVLNEHGDIVQDYGVTDARSFQWLKRRLGLRVERTDDA